MHDAEFAFSCFVGCANAIIDSLAEFKDTIKDCARPPKLIVIGDKSSGKSSLISALTEIKLPKIETRCPLHIQTSRSQVETWRVYITQNYELSRPETELPITGDDKTEGRRLPPWKRLPENDQVRHEFRSVIDGFDIEEVQAALRRGQAAILNPSRKVSDFKPPFQGESTKGAVEKLEEDPEVRFSPNTLTLEVTGPNLRDREFYELPGGFVEAKQPEDEGTEKMVKNLTREYISLPDATILWAVSMVLDVNSSYTFNLIRHHKVQDRCIGVMTKADLVSQDKEGPNHWVQVLDGTAYNTGIAYIVTSNQDGGPGSTQNRPEAAFLDRVDRSSQHRYQSGTEKLDELLGAERLRDLVEK